MIIHLFLCISNIFSFNSFRILQLVNQLKEQSISQDKELLEEKTKNMSNIVKMSLTTKKKAAKKKESKPEDNVKEDAIVCFEYLEKVNAKRGRNKRKLQELGLIEKTPTPKKGKQMDLKGLLKKKANTKVRRKIMQSDEKNNENREKMKCPYDHACYSTSYKEESDRRYLDSKNDLFGVNCQVCSKGFSMEEEANTITPSQKQPMYVCLGRGKHQCTHSICYKCYHELFMKHRSRRRSTRKD